MLLQLSIQLWGKTDIFRGAVIRYSILRRMFRLSSRHHIQLLAFGFGEDELRLVVDGTEMATREWVRAWKIGTQREFSSLGLHFEWSYGRYFQANEDDLEATLAWAHRIPTEAHHLDPLATPWSSHRDILGYRLADFYDASLVRHRINPARLHRLAGGGSLPADWPPTVPSLEPLSLLLRIAGAVIGVLPADRQCFGLFAHLAKVRGWKSQQVAEALAVTPRRIRQLTARDETRMSLALAYLSDPKLAIVP